MTSRLVIGFAIATAVSGCLPPSTTPAPRPLKPEEGPSGTIHADFFGGQFTRQIQTRFRVDNAAYVLVGHLGGDGVIRVLYPQTPWASGWVARNKTVMLKPYTAMHDMSPHLFSYATAPYRSMGAQIDSYDGLGYGYVFMIVSRRPIDYFALQEGSGFDALEILDYATTRDPRYAIRSLADGIATGPYTLKFASSRTSNSYALATGCGMQWGLNRGLDPFSPFMGFGYSFFDYPGSALMNGLAFAQYSRLHGMTRSCRGSQYAYSSPLYREYSNGVTTVPVPGTPPGPLTPRLQRPERRTFTDPERTAIIGGRSSIDRGSTASRSSFAGERRSRRPIGSGSEYPTRTRGYEVTRPTHTEVRGPERASRPIDTPRLATPSQPPTTTTSTATTGGETRAERPRPQP